MWGWHNRGCVWDNKEEWTSKRERCQTIEDKRDVVTFASNHPTIHRTRIGKRKKDKLTAKNQEYWVPLMYPSTFANEGPTVQLCGDGNIAQKMNQW